MDEAALRKRMKSISTARLFKFTLEGSEDDKTAWAAIGELRTRNNQDVFDRAVAYLNSENAKKRSRGLSVLAQLGGGQPKSKRPFMAKSVTLAIKYLSDPNSEVVASAAFVLGHLEDKRSIPKLLTMSSHRNAEVRFAVAFGLRGSEFPGAVPTMLHLMEDKNRDVRDWATFGIGTLGEADTPEIRASLRRRLDDSFRDVRQEARWGLAKRKDPEGLRLMLEYLESDQWVRGDESTASDLLNLGLQSELSIEELCSGLRRLLTKSTAVRRKK